MTATLRASTDDLLYNVTYNVWYVIHTVWYIINIVVNREGVMEFLLANHPLDCPICDQGGECDLQVNRGIIHSSLDGLLKPHSFTELCYAYELNSWINAPLIMLPPHVPEHIAMWRFWLWLLDSHLELVGFWPHYLFLWWLCLRCRVFARVWGAWEGNAHLNYIITDTKHHVQCYCCVLALSRINPWCLVATEAASQRESGPSRIRTSAHLSRPSWLVVFSVLDVWGKKHC